MSLSERRWGDGVTGGVSPHLLSSPQGENRGGVTGVSPRGDNPTQGWAKWGDGGDGSMSVTPSPHPSAIFDYKTGKTLVTPPPGVTA